MKIYILCTFILISSVTCRRRWTTRSTTKSTIPPAVFESNLTNFDPDNVWDPFDDSARYDLDLAYYDNFTDLDATTTVKAPTTKNIYYNDTIDYQGVIRFFRIYNKTPFDLRVHEVTYDEYYNGTRIHGTYWRHLPMIEAYHDSRKHTFTQKNFTNVQVEQRWTAVVGYNDKTYVTIRPSVVHLIPADCVYVTYLIVDELKEKFVVNPPKSGQAKAYFHCFDGNLTYSDPEELESKLNELKQEVLREYPPEDDYIGVF